MSTRASARKRAFATVAAAACVAAVTLMPTSANAAIVPTVQLGTAESFAVLAGSTVTNTGASRLHEDLGLWDAPVETGVAVTGFGPGAGDGQLVPPAEFHIDDAVAEQAQADLTAAYVDAANRPGATSTGTADLGGLELQGGVYDVPGGAIELTGTLTLDGAGNADSVFIFQADSTLITASSSTVKLINGAQACNVFWQVGSSATLGETSVFVGNILALTSITVNNGVTVDGRALARNGAVTLINDTFKPTACAAALPVIDVPFEPPATTTTTTAPTTTTTRPTTTTTTAPATTTTTAPVGTSPTTTPGATPDAGAPGTGPVAGSPEGTAVATPLSGPVAGSGGPGTPISSATPGTPTGPGAPGAPAGPRAPGTGGGTSTGTPTGQRTTSGATPGAPTGGLARTGSPLGLTFLVGLALLGLGVGAVRVGRTS